MLDEYKLDVVWAWDIRTVWREDATRRPSRT